MLSNASIRKAMRYLLLGCYLGAGLFGIGLATSGTAMATTVDPRPAGGSLIDLEETRDGHVLALMGLPGLDAQFPESHFNVLRFKRDTSLDDKFGQDGFANPFDKFKGVAAGMAIAPDGRIAAVGYRHQGKRLRSPLVAVMLSNGKLDKGFARGGRIGSLLQRKNPEVYRDAAFQSNRRLVVVGTRNEYEVKDQVGLVRAYRRNGSVDRRFGDKGTVTLSASKHQDDTGFDSVLVLRNSKILVSGYLNGIATVLRLKANGRIDRSFGRRGYAQVETRPGDYCYSRCVDDTSLALGAAGQITIATSDGQNEVTVGRFNRGGTPVRAFGGDGVARYTRKALEPIYPETKHFAEMPRIVSVNDIGLFPDGGVAVALSIMQNGTGNHYGYAEFHSTILVFDRSGKPDSGFGSHGAEIGNPEDTADSVLVRGNHFLIGSGNYASGDLSLIGYRR